MNKFYENIDLCDNEDDADIFPNAESQDDLEEEYEQNFTRFMDN